jgi:hypothetical protein
VACYGELVKQSHENGVRLESVRQVVRETCEARLRKLGGEGFKGTDPRCKKEQAVIDFCDALLRGGSLPALPRVVDPAAKMQATIAPLAEAVANHSLWGKLTTESALRIFMRHHVYCVWDFMALLKALQARLTCLDVQWRPSESTEACRLINEIVTGEESDQLECGRVLSHYELYIEAMQEVGADTESVKAFLESEADPSKHPETVGMFVVPIPCRQFMRVTFRHSQRPLCGALAAFTAGREEVIPTMFRSTLKALQDSGVDCKTFELYLDRHIELDGDTHGPMARRLLESFCHTEKDWQTATECAVEALEARAELWDRIEAAIEASWCD